LEKLKQKSGKPAALFIFKKLYNMSDYIKKEMARVVVGAKCNDLVLRTLGKVYVSTGGQM
jgi:hypothetical protein